MEKSRINLSEIHSWVFRSKGCYACNLFPNSSETCMRVHVCVCVEREYTQSEQGKTLTLCWSWSSNTLATWHEELTHWKRPWCWERLKAGGEADNRGWDGWWHHWLNGHEFEQAPGVGDGQGSLVCCSPWGCKELDMTERLKWTELNSEESGWRINMNLYSIFCNFSKSLQLFPITLFFIFWPHCVACRILASWPGIKPMLPAMETQF